MSCQAQNDFYASDEEAAMDYAVAVNAEIRDLPIVSPHGHTDPRWYAQDQPFPDPARLFIVPDHYIFRMLYSQGVPLEELGIPRLFYHSAESGIRLKRIDADPAKRKLHW